MDVNELVWSGLVGVDIRKIGKNPIYIGKSPVFGHETLRDTKIIK